MVPFSAHTVRDAVDIHAMLSRTTLISAIPLVSDRTRMDFRRFLYRLKRSRFPGTNGQQQVGRQ